MERNLLYKKWKNEEEMAFIKGGNFNYIKDRYREEAPVPWDFEKVVEKYSKGAPLVLDFRTYRKSKRIPIPDASYGVVIDKYGVRTASEIYRMLKMGGIYIFEQTGSVNSRNLVDAILPVEERPLPVMQMDKQVEHLKNMGFEILASEQANHKIRFADVGAFIWFARATELKNPIFAVDNEIDHLIEMQEMIENGEPLKGTIRRFYVVARKIK